MSYQEPHYVKSLLNEEFLMLNYIVDMVILHQFPREKEPWEELFSKDTGVNLKTWRYWNKMISTKSEDWDEDEEYEDYIVTKYNRRFYECLDNTDSCWYNDHYFGGCSNDIQDQVCFDLPPQGEEIWDYDMFRNGKSKDFAIAVSMTKFGAKTEVRLINFDRIRKLELQ